MYQLFGRSDGFICCSAHSVAGLIEPCSAGITNVCVSEYENERSNVNSRQFHSSILWHIDMEKKKLSKK